MPESDPNKIKLDTPAILDELGRKNAAPPVRTVRSSLLPFLFLFLMILALAGAGGWIYGQQLQARAELDTRLAVIRQNNQELREDLAASQVIMQEELESQLAQLQQSRDALSAALGDLSEFEQTGEQRLNRLQQQMTRDMQDVTSLVNALQRQVGNLQQRDIRWFNAEADYLMRLAQRKLVMESDVTSSVLLLQSVRSLLQDQPGLLADTARRNLENDLRALQSVQLPDRSIVLRELSQLEAAIEQLTLAGMRQDGYTDGVRQAWQSTPDQAQQSSWWAAGLDLLRTIFVWRQWDESPAEMLPSQHEGIIKQQLAVLLEQARLSVLQRDQLTYEQTLARAAELLRNYFVQDSARSGDVLVNIERLQSAELQAALPDLSSSAELIRQLAGGATAADI
jgi:uroporphyrin-III C-methyltransferase